MNDHEYILTLLQKETLSDSEIEFLAARNAQDPSDPLWETAAEQFVIRMKQLNGHPASEAAKLALTKILEQLGKTEHPITPVHRVHFLKTAWFKYAAAVLLLLAGGATYYIFHTSQSQVEMVQTTPSPLSKDDVMPGSEKAILTLSNGEKVQLNNATSETINDGTLSIENNNGQLSYKNADVFAINTMSTPKGGQYKLTLADGTKVWLNAASSITYPTAFKGKTREVAITGEAYFEVVKNAKQPFIVKTPKDEITVLGTSFNVNSYADEIPKTSLIEGSVLISPAGANAGTASGTVSPAGGSTPSEARGEGGSLPAGRQGVEARTATGIILKPNQAYQNGKVTSTNISQDIAWKNGFFNFNQMSLQEVLRQISRWYDVDIVYQGTIKPKKFWGEIQRDLNLSEVLDVLKEAGVGFTIEGRKLVVKSH